MPTVDELLLGAWNRHQRGEVDAAARIYRSVLEKHPDHSHAWCYVGIACHDQRRYAEAASAYQRALALQPDFPIALNNLGNTLRFLGRIEEADAAFEKALALQPDYFNAWRNRGTLHAWTGRIDLAFEYYHRAMQLQPEDAELHRNLGVIHLLQGNFREGWREYRYRWKCREAVQHRYPQPRWEGQDLRGKTILLYSEQGLGDTLHFVRFAKVLRDRGARTILHMQPSLLAILQGCRGIDAIIPNSWPVEQPFDFHCSLIDVADVLQVDLDSIPDEVPYLRVPENLSHYWKHQLPRVLPSSDVRIGLVWQGNPDHQADAFRSIPLRELEPLVDLPGVQWVSLQFGKGSEQLAAWHGTPPIQSLPSNLDQSSGAFMDTAAILQQLDAIVTTDTAMAHLAGALAKPTFLMLGATPDWRWLLDREDSPWYPSLRLIRQTTIGDWRSVAVAARASLERWLRPHSPKSRSDS